MTAEELYKKLDDLSLNYIVVDVMEGLRVINIEVDEEEGDE